MQALMEFGVAFVVWLQLAGDWLVPPMRFFSYLGTVDFFLVFLPFLYWCADSALGLRVGVILMTSDVLNYAFKLLFAAPRPYWVSPRARGLWAETSFGIPSGHAQHAVSVWGMSAAYLKKTPIWVAALLLIFFIGFSRVYLGAHFPHDVLFGWLLGAALLWLFVRFWQPVEDWLAGKPLPQKILAAFLASALLILVGYGAASLRSGYQVPPEWTANALRAETPEAPDPVRAETPFTAAGTLFGLAVGAAWMESQGGFRAAGKWDKRALRYLVGMVGVAVLYAGLGALFPRGDSFFFYALRYLRYALVGWWVTGGAPWLFLRLRLA